MFYLLDVVMNLHIGYVISRGMRQRLLLDGRQVARLYLLHGTLLVDILAFIPVIPEVGLSTLLLYQQSRHISFAQCQKGLREATFPRPASCWCR